MATIRLQSEVEKKRGIYYQLDSNDQPIGVGGMGQVFKGICVDERTGSTRLVAIKFMYDDLPPHVIERARREASIQLRNDNLVEMLGFIEIPERTPIGDVKMHYHVVSELLTGVSLSDLMDGKTTDRNGQTVAFAEKLLADYKNDSERFARTIVINVLSGLMALHDAGYIHRDIDPSNIMVTHDGHIKLIDFGIAKQMRTLTTNDKGLTVAGKFMGKPEYAAPELVLGDIQHQDQTTDIYAMGILLYQCITGHTPFEGPRHEILEHQLKDKLPLNAIKNKALRKIVATACEKKQDLRYQTTSHMRAALETKSKVPVTLTIPRETKIAIAAVVTAILLVAVGYYFYKNSSTLILTDSDKKNVAEMVAYNNVNSGGTQLGYDKKALTKEEDKPGNNAAPSNNKETTKVKANENKSAKEDTKPVNEKKTAKNEEPKVSKVSEANSKPVQKSEANSKPAQNTQASTQTKVSFSKKGNLAYASWSGSVSGGKPVGFGTMVFTSPKSISCSNGKRISASEGDKIENAEFDEDGYLYQGTFIKKDGQTTRIMP